MINFKEKSQMFIMGMMAGLIIAGGFFILKLDDYFTELNFYKNVAKTFYINSKSSESVIKTDETKQSDKTKPNLAGSKKRILAKANSTKKSNVLLNADTLKNHFITDSISYSNPTEDIVVRKDELLSTKTVEVINLNPVESNANHSDSLLQKVSGIRDDKNSTTQFFNVELWQSPLNYKGYKMSKYKIIVYGINSTDGIKMYKMDEDIYFKNASVVYKLEPSDDFKPYQSVVDPSIINKLK